MRAPVHRVGLFCPGEPGVRCTAVSFSFSSHRYAYRLFLFGLSISGKTRAEAEENPPLRSASAAQQLAAGLMVCVVSPCHAVSSRKEKDVAFLSACTKCVVHVINWPRAQLSQ